MACHKVTIGRKSFKADCGRKKRQDGVQRQKPHWGKDAKAAAKKRAMNNDAFVLAKSVFKTAAKDCHKSHKPGSRGLGACIAKEFGRKSK